MARFFNHEFFNSEKPMWILILLASFAVLTSESMRHSFRGGHHSSQQTVNVKPLPIPVPEYFRLWRGRFLKANTPPEGNDPLGLVRGIFLGDDSSVPSEVRERFRTAGLSHLLAASGFNCWIVAAAFGIVAKLLLYFFSSFFTSKTLLSFRKYISPVSQFAGAWLFWLWTDQSPPITRSVVMISAKFALELLGTPVSFLRLLFVQYLCSLIVLPRLWHSVSFQLTFGCLFGIILFPPLVERFAPEGAYLKSMWNYFAVSFGACLGTIPTTWIAFEQINFTSLTTNWFAVPPVSFILMPVSLTQMLLLAPGLPMIKTGVLANIAGVTAHLLNQALTLWMSVMPSLCFS